MNQLESGRGASTEQFSYCSAGRITVAIGRTSPGRVGVAASIAGHRASTALQRNDVRRTVGVRSWSNLSILRLDFALSPRQERSEACRSTTRSPIQVSTSIRYNFHLPARQATSTSCTTNCRPISLRGGQRLRNRQFRHQGRPIYCPARVVRWVSDTHLTTFAPNVLKKRAFNGRFLESPRGLPGLIGFWLQVSTPLFFFEPHRSGSRETDPRTA